MAIVIKEIQVHTTVEKSLPASPRLTPEIAEKLKADLKKELLRVLRREVGAQRNNKR